MFLIILTGILSAGIIPLLAAIGYGVELVVNIFTTVTWGYWQNSAIGLISLIIMFCVFRVPLLRLNMKMPKDTKTTQ
jgi:uncharacterized membrane protein YcjF (UPF0283 family)